MLTKVDCTLCENMFGRYCVPRSSQHRPVSQAVLNGQAWELETIIFMRQHVGGRDVVHAGMYFGDFLPGLASAMAPNRTIYGFEPNQENHACAQWTVVLNGLTNDRTCNAALAAARGHAQMRIATEEGRALGGLSHVIEDDAGLPGNGKSVSPVRLVTIDEELPATADVGILQLDFEEYEAWRSRVASRRYADVGRSSSSRQCQSPLFKRV